MTQTEDLAAVGSASTCTPCRLGIHSCCNNRVHDCECSAAWHRDHRAGIATTARAPGRRVP